MKSLNRIEEIRNGTNLTEHLAYARERLFKEGAVDSSVLEIISYFKLFQPEFFKEHESDIIGMMGLYFKNSIPDTFVNLIFSDYGKYIKETFGDEYAPVQADILKKIKICKLLAFPHQQAQVSHLSFVILSKMLIMMWQSLFLHGH